MVSQTTGLRRSIEMLYGNEPVPDQLTFDQEEPLTHDIKEYLHLHPSPILNQKQTELYNELFTTEGHSFLSKITGMDEENIEDLVTLQYQDDSKNIIEYQETTRSLEFIKNSMGLYECESLSIQMTPEEILGFANAIIAYKKIESRLVEPIRSEIELSNDHVHRYIDIGSHDGKSWSDQEDHLIFVLKTRKPFAINATPITFGEKRYIATQGPTPDTTGDFCHMLFTDMVETVVAIVNPTENKAVKCEQYWPENIGASYRTNPDQMGYRYTITCKELLQETKITTRTLQIEKKNQDGKLLQTRTIRHIHYANWADRGIEPIPLAHKLQVHAGPITKKAPLVVHCSAGVGRTGLFIALHKAAEELSEEDKETLSPNEKIAIAGEAMKFMREHRTSMIQTARQFQLVYLSLLSKHRHL